jgi:type I restriction enzyme S subunit
MTDKTVGDYVTLRRGITYNGKLVGKPGPALLGLGAIEPGGGFRERDYRTYGGACPPELMLSPGDLFVSLKGATKAGDMIGSVAQVPPTVPSGRLTQDTVKLEFRDSDPELARYLYWLLRTPDYRSYCAGRATGSAVVALSRRDFLAYPVPQLTSKRRKVVALLNAIEEKSRNNAAGTATIEAIARAFFQSWFADFEPVRANLDDAVRAVGTDYALFPKKFDHSPGGLLPHGWSRGHFGDVAQNAREGVQADDIDPATPYVALEHMPRRSVALGDWSIGEPIASNKFQFERGQILFGKLRPYFHKVAIAPVDGVCSTDILVIAPKSSEWFSFCLLCASSDEMIAHADGVSTGTKMPRCNWRDLAAFETAIPPPAIARAFDALLRPMMERIVAGVHQSRTLTTLRNALLPNVLSPDIAIGDAEREVGKAV